MSSIGIRNLGNVAVQRVHQLVDALAGGIVSRRGLRGRIGGATDHRGVVAIILILGKELADFHLDEVEHFRIFNEIALVEEHDDLRHAHLAGEQHVLARLRHRAVNGGHHEDGAIHLRRARDHVLHVVSVSRAVDVRVVAVRRSVLDVGRGDREDLRRVTTTGGLGSLRHLVVLNLFAKALQRLHMRDCSRQRGLTVVDMANGADVHVRLTAAIKRFFCHFYLL